MMDAPGSLKGLTVLLVEDESMVSMLAEDVFIDAGCTVLLAMRLGEALELARESAIDFAVLDVNLGGGDTSYPLADILVARQIPFIFATGYSADGLDSRFTQCPRLQKPYAPSQLVQAASLLTQRQPLVGRG